MGHTQNQKRFLWHRNNKSRSSAFRNFLFYQYILTELGIFFYLEQCFFLKKVSIPAKTAVANVTTNVFSHYFKLLKNQHRHNTSAWFQQSFHLKCAKSKY